MLAISWRTSAVINVVLAALAGAASADIQNGSTLSLLIKALAFGACGGLFTFVALGIRLSTVRGLPWALRQQVVDAARLGRPLSDPSLATPLLALTSSLVKRAR